MHFILAVSLSAAVYLAALMVLLLVGLKRMELYALFKGICSLCFVASSLLFWCIGAQNQLGLFALLLGALLLCAAGDVALGVANRAAPPRKKPFLVGVALFTLAHFVFAIFYILLRVPAPAEFLIPLVLPALLFLLEKMGAVRLGRMRPIGYFYTYLVGFMFVRAASVAVFSAGLGPVAVVLLLGAALFLLSDVFLLFLYFGTVKREWLRHANLVSYYLGMYLLAQFAFAL